MEQDTIWLARLLVFLFGLCNAGKEESCRISGKVQQNGLSERFRMHRKMPLLNSVPTCVFEIRTLMRSLPYC